MSLDKTTDSIAHFVGLFHMAVEDARLRDQYIEFQAEKDKPDEEVKLDFNPVRFNAGLALDDYAPKISYSPEATAQAAIGSKAFAILPLQSHTHFSIPFLPIGYVPASSVGSPSSQDDSKSLPFVPMPPQMITITLQSITLSDNDIFGDPAGADFISNDVFLSELAAVVQLAEALQPWSLEGLATAVLDDPEAALEFMATMGEVEAPNVPDLSTYVLRNTEATTDVIVDGAAVEERPEADDFLPEFIRLKRDEAPDESDASEPGALPDRPLSGVSKDPKALHAEDDDLPQYQDSDHNVVSGANESHNSVSIFTKWIDASVFAVAGDVIELDAISQTNILSDHDTHLTGLKTHGFGASQSNNIASIQTDKSTTEDQETDDETGSPTDLEDAEVAEDASAAGEESAPFSEPLQEEDVGGPSLVLPSEWNLARVEGDVVYTNVVQQHTFATDTDQVNLTLTANSTVVSTGENLMFNQFQASEFGFGYDLVIVGGSMTTMNVINQTNVLLDDDYLTGEGLAQASVSSHDNSLVNDASIEKIGVDEQEDMLDEFTAAIADLTAGVEQLAANVAQNALFEGLEVLRALYIEGDLIQMNIVDQINHIGDQDQVHMAQDAIMSALDGVDVSITTGSNYLTNTASIVQDGIDSTVMAAGDHYSDALLYTAELIDTEADPLGVNITQLANEAVAIIVNDLTNDIAQATHDLEAGITDLQSGGTSFDVMQTLTA